MGLIAKIIEFTSKFRILASAFAGHRTTVKLALPPGYEGAALKNDSIVIIPLDGSSRYVGVGVADMSVPQCDSGEVLLYSRDSGSSKKARVHLKASGEIEIVNNTGSITLNTDGTVDISADAVINNISFSAHVHTCADVGLPSGAPMTPLP